MKPLALGIATALAVCAFTVSLAQTPAADPLPPGPAKDTVMKVCTACHDASMFTDKRFDENGWDDIVQTMAGRGAQASNDEFKQIVQYLAANLGPEKPTPANPPPAP